MDEPKVLTEPQAFVQFSEVFVQQFRRSHDEALERRLKEEMENPETFQKFLKIQQGMGKAADDEDLPQELRDALDHPDEFPAFAEGFVQFFVKLTGDESLPEELQRIASEGRKLSGDLQEYGYTEKFEEKLNKQEVLLRRQQEQNKRLLSHSREAIVEKARTDLESWIQTYQKGIRAGQRAQQIFREAEALAREAGLESSEEDLAEDDDEDIAVDPDFIRSYSSLVQEVATLELKTLHHSVMSFEGLLDQYAGRKRKRNRDRLLFGAFALVVALVGLAFGGLIDSRWPGIVGTILGILLFAAEYFVIGPMLDKRRIKQRRNQLKASLLEFYPTSVRARLHLAFVHKYFDKYPASSPGETIPGAS